MFFRFIASFCLFFNFLGHGMDISLYDPKPIFCVWALCQKPQLIRDVREVIIQQYIEEKRLFCQEVYGNSLRKVKIALPDLILIKDDYIDGFDMLNCSCATHWRWQDSFFELTEKEYQTVYNLPVWLRSKFDNIDNKNPHSIEVIVEKIGKKEIFFRD